MALVGPQQIAVEAGDVRQVVVAAGEVREASQVGPVLDDGARGGAAVEFEPAEVLGDGLGPRLSRLACELSATAPKSTLSPARSPSILKKLPLRPTSSSTPRSALPSGRCSLLWPREGAGALLAQVAIDARSGTLGILTVSAPGDTDGPAVIDSRAGKKVLADPALELYQPLWQEPLDRDELTPTRGCSVPTFHGSAADLAAEAREDEYLFESSHAEPTLEGRHCRFRS